jgi:hypothetical protein
MPERKTLSRARADRKAGKAPSTQAGEFVREQIEHIRQGKHGARSAKQAIAIGLSEARRAGVDLPPPSGRKVSARTRKQAARDYARGHEPSRKPVSATRSRATENALKREDPQAVSKAALSRQARGAAARRSPAERSAAAQRAARTRRQAARRSGASAS